jgi:serine/threonine protein kinase
MQGLLLAGRYRLADSIGSGGMGRVWRAHDEVLHRTVAIKELTAALYVSEGERSVLLARTRAEARAAARINHSAVVTVHDVLEHDGRPWIVMELVEGGSLADAVKESGSIEPREAARVGLWVLRALRAAHSAGVLHRDVKPGNVLLSQDGRVLLTDFGIAQVEGDTTITRTGEIVGSVDYLAPERIRGEDPGPSSDLWALGATLYTAVEGLSPFRRTTPLTTMQAVVAEEPAAPQNAGALTSVITALLRKDPAERPGPDEAEQMLAEAAEGRTPHSAQVYVPTQHVAGTQLPQGTNDSGPQGTNDSGPQATYDSGSQGPYGSGSQGSTYGSGSQGTYGSAQAVAPGSQDATHAAGQGPPYGASGSQNNQYAQDPYGRPVGHDTYGSHGRPVPDPAVTTANQPAVVARPGRRRFRTVAAVVLAAALVGGGGVAALLLSDEWRSTDTSSSSDPSSSAENGEGDGDGDGKQTDGAAAGDVPDGWERVDDVQGFSLVLPKGWERQVEGTQVDYTPDDGKHFVRIAVDDSPDFDSPSRHLEDLEQQVSVRLVDYQQVSMESNTFRDRPGALWDFTWTALSKDTEFPGPRRAIEQAYLSRDGVEYVIYMSSPVADWDTAREQFDTILRGWRPPAS